MIGWLRGRVVREELEGALIVDVGGVGYELSCPLGTAGRAAKQADRAVELWVHVHAREDALELFGFADAVERRVFRLLIGVPNIGPKTALAILGALPPPELTRAVADRDMRRLGKISGVGKKTAERLVMELREKLASAATAAPPAPDEPAPSPGSAHDRLVSALTNMGYRKPEAEKAVRALGKRLEADLPLADLLREALGQLTS